MPSRQERRKVSVGSILFLIHRMRVEHHRPAVVGVDEISVYPRVLSVIRIPAVDAIFANVRAIGARPGLALEGLRSFGEG